MPVLRHISSTLTHLLSWQQHMRGRRMSRGNSVDTHICSQLCQAKRSQRTSRFQPKTLYFPTKVNLGNAGPERYTKQPHKKLKEISTATAWRKKTTTAMFVVCRPTGFGVQSSTFFNYSYHYSCVATVNSRTVRKQLLHRAHIIQLLHSGNFTAFNWLPIIMNIMGRIAHQGVHC